MKKYASILLLMVLGLSVLLITSCAKPTVPNFEEISIPTNVWDYEHVVWFDINYVELDKGSANVDIWMSAKGVDPNATLKIVTQDIVFDQVVSYTEGKIYYGGSYNLLNMDQPVAYEIVNGDETYTGNIALETWPQKVNVATWPEFNENTNYSPSWTISADPKFHVIDAGAYGADTDVEIFRQIAGTEKTFLLDQTYWNDIKPIEEFFFGINAIGYEMMNKNKVLIAGVSHSYYDWMIPEDKASPQPRRNPFRFMDQIQADIDK